MKKDSPRQKIAEFATFPVISSVLTLMFGFVISEVQDKVGFSTLMLGLLVFLVTYGLTLLVVTTQLRPISIGFFEEINQRLSNLIDRNAIGIIETCELVRQEATQKVSEVWLVTCDLAEDIFGAPFYEVVDANLKKGTSYVYFCPQSTMNEGRARAIKESHGKMAGELVIKFLPDDFFFLTPKLDFSILDPFNKSKKRVGYMGLPMASDSHLHCPMDQELLDCLVGRLSKLL